MTTPLLDQLQTEIQTQVKDIFLQLEAGTITKEETSRLLNLVGRDSIFRQDLVLSAFWEALTTETRAFIERGQLQIAENEAGYAC